MPFDNKKAQLPTALQDKEKKVFGSTLLKSSYKAFWVHKNKQVKPYFCDTNKSPYRLTDIHTPLIVYY